MVGCTPALIGSRGAEARKKIRALDAFFALFVPTRSGGRQIRQATVPWFK